MLAKIAKSKNAAKKGKQTKIASAQRIGILSSIPYQGTALETAFVAGVSNATISYTIFTNSTLAALGRDAQTLDNDASVDLIVTMGGFIAYEAASSNVQQKVFISIVGGGPLPNPPSGFFFGGINLETLRHIPDRIDFLKNKLSIASSQICFVYNPNSRLAGLEVVAWRRAGGGRIFPTNDSSVYTARFNTIANDSTISAVVVSADPYFRSTMDAFVAAANQCGKYICYALQDYGRANPKHDLTTLYGPNLTDHIGTAPLPEYQKLGQKASSVLATGASSTLNSASQIITNV